MPNSIQLNDSIQLTDISKKQYIKELQTYSSHFSKKIHYDACYRHKPNRLLVLTKRYPQIKLLLQLIFISDVCDLSFDRNNDIIDVCNIIMDYVDDILEIYYELVIKNTNHGVLPHIVFESKNVNIWLEKHTFKFIGIYMNKKFVTCDCCHDSSQANNYKDFVLMSHISNNMFQYQNKVSVTKFDVDYNYKNNKYYTYNIIPLFDDITNKKVKLDNKTILCYTRHEDMIMPVRICDIDKLKNVSKIIDIILRIFKIILYSKKIDINNS